MDRNKFNKFRDIMTDVIHRNHYATFLSCERAFDQIGLMWQGASTIRLPDMDHIVLWAGWNDNSIAYLEELLREGAVKLSPMVPLAYQAEGRYPKLPVAGVIPECGYTEDHWLPVLLVRTVNQ